MVLCRTSAKLFYFQKYFMHLFFNFLFAEKINSWLRYYLLLLSYTFCASCLQREYQPSIILSGSQVHHRYLFFSPRKLVAALDDSGVEEENQSQKINLEHPGLA